MDEAGWFERTTTFVDSVHETVVEGPVDLLQDIGDGTRAVVDDGIDWVQDRVPLGPLNPLIDGGQSFVNVTSEYGNRLIDTGQRLTSPNLYGDLIGDLLALDVPGRVGRWTGDRVDDALDWTGDRIDDLQSVGEGAVDWTGDRVDDAREGAKKLWDNTIGRF